MYVSDPARELLMLCAIRVSGKSVDWSLLARVAQQGGLSELLAGHIPETGSAAGRALPLLREGLKNLDDARQRVDTELRAGDSTHAQLVTVLDHGYPDNLRLVHDLPPFLFIRGELRDDDLRSVAVVGTRQVSDVGLTRAARMSRELVAQGVTVASGLAKGVDTAAHTAALDAGGRTIAVIGTGVTRCYPAENRGLAERIVNSGAIVSQFWPTRPPGRDTFPRRNRVTSGISQGTVVIEASSTSGAKMQARLASEHGKRVWLLRSLVTDQEWARKMVDAGAASEVGATDEVIRDLLEPSVITARSPGRPAEAQMTIEFG